MACCDLVTLTGKIVRIEFPDAVSDDVMETIDNARSRGEWWSSARFAGVTMLYEGLLIDRVDMGKIVGMMT